jgi:hypothetical protein
MTPLILNHRIRWSWRVNYTCRPACPGKGNWHAFNGHHNQCGWFRRREKFIAPTGIQIPNRPARSLVTTPTLISLCIPFNWAISTEMRANEIWFSRRGEIKLISLGFYFCYIKNLFFLGEGYGETTFCRPIQRNHYWAVSPAPRTCQGPSLQNARP